MNAIALLWHDFDIDEFRDRRNLGEEMTDRWRDFRKLGRH